MTKKEMFHMKLYEMVEKQLNDFGEEILGMKDFEYLKYSSIKNAHYLIAFEVDTDEPVIVKKSGPVVKARFLEAERWTLVTDCFVIKEG
jgi:hypothetical protein